MKINGNLQFKTLGKGEIQNAIIERLSSAPTGEPGRIYFNTTDNFYYFFGGEGSPLSWQKFIPETAIDDLLSSIQFNYDSTLHGGPAATHNVFHNLGQRFVNVTVYEQVGSPVSYTQVLPKSVVITNANKVSVTFTSAIDCVVVVMGLPGIGLA